MAINPAFIYINLLGTGCFVSASLVRALSILHFVHALSHPCNIHIPCYCLLVCVFPIQPHLCASETIFLSILCAVFYTVDYPLSGMLRCARPHKKPVSDLPIVHEFKYFIPFQSPPFTYAHTYTHSQLHTLLATPSHSPKSSIWLCRLERTKNGLLCGRVAVAHH